MSQRLQDKVAIITGASRGVGAVNAQLLAKHGAKVVLTDISADGEKIAADINAVCGQDTAIFVKQDVSDEQGWTDLIAQVEQQYGRLDILVNNAAILKHASITDEDYSGWKRIMKINTDSVFLGTHAALPLLEKGNGGSIINMSSSSALMGMPHFVAYSASKAAVRGLTQSVAVYCSQKQNKVRCNTIHPDAIATPMSMEVGMDLAQKGKNVADRARVMNFICTPDAVANTVLFLASDESSHINGAAIPVDNAATITPPYLPNS
jgi:3(or 17)beta-hydroxysteroid dehydrogenase